MTRAIFSGALRVGRTAALALGVGVMLAVVFGVVSTALAHSGVDTKLLHLGHSNTARALSTLAGSLAGPVLKVDNNGSGPAVQLEVGNADVPANNVAPMKVNSSKVVTNLNADKVDGKSSTNFYAAGSKVADSVHADQADLAREAGTANAAGDADMLDGIDSTGFVRGHGRALASAVDISPGSEVDVLSHSDRLPNIQATYNCPGDLATNGLLTIWNHGNETLNVFWDDASTTPTTPTNPDHRELQQNTGISLIAAVSGEHFTVQVVQGAAIATIEVFSAHLTSDKKCRVQAQGLFTY